MKTMKNVSGYLSAIAIIIVATVFSSCKEDNEDVISESEEIEIANESSASESLSDEELDAFEEELALNPDDGRITGTGCAIVTRDEQAKTVTLDFGEGCVGVYGRKRSGKVIITYGGAFGDNTANRVITFVNYFVNDRQITGAIELRDFNLNTEGKLTATRKRIDLSIHFSDGHKFTSNGSTTVTWIEGGGDTDRTNDVLSITGSYEGISTRGRKITHTIMEPVIVSHACWINGGFARVEGQTELRISGARERIRIVDYGDGSCDQTVTVTINGKEFAIVVS